MLKKCASNIRICRKANSLLNITRRTRYTWNTKWSYFWQWRHAVWYSFAISRHSFEAVGQVITSSLYSSKIARHNSGMKVEIVFRALRKSNCSVWYLSPEAKCRKVIASFKPGSKDFLHNVSFFWIRGPTLFSSSSNISGYIRRKLKKECTSPILSSAISRSYWPYCSILSAESQRRTHMDLHCFCLLLRLCTTGNAASVSIMACCSWSNKTWCNSLLLSVLTINLKQLIFICFLFARKDDNW